MKQFFQSTPFKWIAVGVLALAAPLSSASDVSWSVSVGSSYPAPRVYAPPPPVVYVQPQPVYVQPAPVYVRPRPVYVQPAAVVQYGPTYYVEEGRHRKHKHGHWKHRHEHRHDHRHDYRYNY